MAEMIDVDEIVDSSSDDDDDYEEKERQKLKSQMKRIEHGYSFIEEINDDQSGDEHLKRLINETIVESARSSGHDGISILEKPITSLPVETLANPLTLRMSDWSQSSPLWNLTMNIGQEERNDGNNIGQSDDRNLNLKRQARKNIVMPGKKQKLDDSSGLPSFIPLVPGKTGLCTSAMWERDSGLITLKKSTITTMPALSRQHISAIRQPLPPRISQTSTTNSSTAVNFTIPPALTLGTTWRPTVVPSVSAVQSNNVNTETVSSPEPKQSLCSCQHDLLELRQDVNRMESKMDAMHELIKELLRQRQGPNFEFDLPSTTATTINSSASKSAVARNFSSSDGSSNKFLRSSMAPATRTTTISSSGISNRLQQKGSEFRGINQSTENRTAPPSATCHLLTSDPIDFDSVLAAAAGDLSTEGGNEDILTDHSNQIAFAQERNISGKDSAIDQTIFNGVARAILLFTGRGLSLEHLKEHGPAWLSRVTEKEMQHVIDHFVDELVLTNVGLFDVPWPTSKSKSTKSMVVYCKKYSSIITDNFLEKYGITKRAYNTAIRHKVSQYTLHLSRICDNVLGVVNKKQEEHEKETDDGDVE